jgi:hypothetical protein
MKKRWLRTSIFLLVCVILYLVCIVLYESSLAKQNPYSRAYAHTAQLAFGQSIYFKSRHVFSVDEIILQKCQIKAPKSGVPCYLISGNVPSAAQGCALWRFEKCASIRYDPLLDNNPQIIAQLKQVLRNPCKYLPSTEEIKNEPSRGSIVPLYEYAEDRKLLRCDQKNPTSLKVIIAFDSNKRFTILEKEYMTIMGTGK